MQCASDVILNSRTSLLYRVNSLVQIVVCVLTILISLKAFKLLHRRNVFNNSTRQLLFMSIVYADLHALAFGVLQGWSLYRSIAFSDDPCRVMFTGTECYALTWVTGAAKMSMISVQAALTLERFLGRVLSLFGPSKPYQNQGIVFNIIVAAVAIGVNTYSYSEGPTNNQVPSCLMQRDIPLLRVLYILVLYFIVSLICLILNAAIIYSLKKPKKQSFDLAVRFTMQEVKNSSLAVCIVSVAQFITMTIYVTGSYLLFLSQHSFSPEYFSNVILCLYTIPYAAMCLPVSVILCIRWISEQRKIKICEMTTANKNENMDSRISALEDMWNSKKKMNSKTGVKRKY